MSSESFAEQLRHTDLIYREPVELRDGSTSNFYVDVKKAYGDPALLAMMSEATAANLDQQTTCIAASGYGGLPLGVAVSKLTALPLAMVRDTEKGHGKGGFIDGYVPGEHDVVEIVDDVFTSGRSLRMTAENLRATGAVILGCHAVVARGNASQFELPVSYLLMPEDLAGLPQSNN